MLSSFPTPYPDELLYSIFVRYHIRSGNISFRQTLSEVIGYTSKQSYRLELPSNLDYLANQLPVPSKLKAESFIQNCSLFPFYKCFLTNPEVWLLIDRMRKKTNDPISRVAKIHVSDEPDLKRFLRFCPTCLKQDTEFYGEAYWHCLHQVPGILVCPAHGKILLNSSISTEAASFDFHPICQENFSCEHTNSYSTDVVLRLEQLTQDIVCLMNSRLEFRGLPWLRDRYIHILAKQGLVDVVRGQLVFDDQTFLKEITAFYGQDFLKLLVSFPNRGLGKYFRYSLLGCDMSLTVDRVTHILLIRFLSGSIEDFFTE